jgi:pimeloyl-ACP methyl ester carboxylesterase
MATAVIDGIATRYEVMGSGPPLLMFAPGGFDGTLEKWSMAGVYAKTRLLVHLSRKYSCILFDRRECGQSAGRRDRSLVTGLRALSTRNSELKKST